MEGVGEIVETQSCFGGFGSPWPVLNNGLIYRDLITNLDLETTVVEFYCNRYKHSAPTEGWLLRIQNGQISLDGVVVLDPNTVLRSGSTLLYHRLPWNEPDAPHELDILFEDNDIIALNKPSCLQVLPGGLFQQRTVLTLLQLEWRKRHNLSCLSGEEFPAPAHRLGRGTSGVLLCAKTKQAKRCLAKYFADGSSFLNGESCRHLHTEKKYKPSILKIYRALVNGIISEDEVIIRQPIGLVPHGGVAKGLYVASSAGKPALSKVDVIERDFERDCTLVEVEIQSGRPHQIRIHLSFIGHPLVGDPLYVNGGTPRFSPSQYETDTVAVDGGYVKASEASAPGDCGYHLHSHKLLLSHPTIMNKVIKIAAPLPTILQSTEEKGGQTSHSRIIIM